MTVNDSQLITNHYIGIVFPDYYCIFAFQN